MLEKFLRDMRLNQREAAEALGISQTYVSLIISGKKRLTERIRKSIERYYSLHGTPTRS